MHGGRRKTSSTLRQSAWDALLKNDGLKEKRGEGGRGWVEKKRAGRDPVCVLEASCCRCCDG